MVTGLRGALGVGGGVEDLVADHGLDVQALVVDRQHREAGFQRALADRVGDLDGVLADQADADERVAGVHLQLRGRWAGVEVGVAGQAEGGDPAAQGAVGADGVGALAAGVQRLLGVRAQRLAGRGELAGGGGCARTAARRVRPRAGGSARRSRAA